MKRMLSMLLVIAVLLGATALVSCDKKKDKELNPGGETNSNTFGDAGTIDDSGKNPDDGEEGKLNVGEDTEGDKYGEFIPYK